MSPILRAFDLFRRERGLWKYALKPMLWGVLAYVLVVLATASFGGWIGLRFGGLFGEVAGALIGLIAPVVFGGAIYLALVGLIAGFGFDKLSMEVEERVYGRAVGTPLGFAAGISDGVARALLTGFLGVIALCMSWTVVIPWLVASFLCLMDFTAPSLLRRGASLGNQFGRARRLPGATPFALVCGVIVLIPVVNVLALPILVTAGTLMVTDGDARARA